MPFLDGGAKRQLNETSEYEASQKLIIWYLVVAADYEEIGLEKEIEIFSTATIQDLLQQVISTTPWMTPFEDMIEIQQNPGRKRLPAIRSVKECGSTSGNPLLIHIPTKRKVILDTMLGNYFPRPWRFAWLMRARNIDSGIFVFSFYVQNIGQESIS